MAVGWRKREQTRVELAGPLADKDMRWLPAVHAIDAAKSKLLLQDGTEEPYDYLVITTGPKLAFDEVPGSGRTGTPSRSALRPCARCLGALPEVPEESRPDRGRRRGRRQLLRPGL